ncbi:hypothetical protein HPB51_019014 [Rhipicephalus microplus]|uniref:Uncharacterized protein n=1 Tax=Rhipicephalus microplus TaxID=6941 RepID=A0A9J6D7B4_RHIMP|nr:hypothetical protein HPB51_019014 [Rhipicephalus microplus]
MASEQTPSRRSFLLDPVAIDLISFVDGCNSTGYGPLGDPLLSFTGRDPFFGAPYGDASRLNEDHSPSQATRWPETRVVDAFDGRGPPCSADDTFASRVRPQAPVGAQTLPSSMLCAGPFRSDAHVGEQARAPVAAAPASEQSPLHATAARLLNVLLEAVRSQPCALKGDPESASDANLNEPASDAKRIQGDILAAGAYQPPPPPSASLEPHRAWAGRDSSHWVSLNHEAASAARDRDALDVSDRALDPYSYARAATVARQREKERKPRAPAHERISNRGAPTAASDQTLRSSKGSPKSPLVGGKGVVRFRCRERGHTARECNALQPTQGPARPSGNGVSRRNDFGEGEAVTEPQGNRDKAGSNPRHWYNLRKRT